MYAVTDSDQVLIITNYPEGETEMLEVVNNVENPEMGTRQMPFGREL